MSENYPSDNVVMEPAYETDEGIEFIQRENKEFIAKQHKIKKFRLVFHFLTIDRDCLYAVLNADKWSFSPFVTDYFDNHPFTKKTLYMLLQMGKFDIGRAVHGSYHIITDITPYFHKNNVIVRIICSGLSMASYSSSVMEAIDVNKRDKIVSFDLFKLANNNTIRMPNGE